MIGYNVEKALQDSMVALIASKTELTPLSVSWPNAELSSVKSDTWLDIDNLVASSGPATMGDCGEDELRGIYQVLVKTKPNSGAANVNKIRDIVHANYPAGASFTYDGVTVKITGASAGAAHTIGGYYVLPLSIKYYTRFRRR